MRSVCQKSAKKSTEFKSKNSRAAIWYRVLSSNSTSGWAGSLFVSRGGSCQTSSWEFSHPHAGGVEKSLMLIRLHDNQARISDCFDFSAKQGLENLGAAHSEKHFSGSSRHFPASLHRCPSLHALKDVAKQRKVKEKGSKSNSPD